MKPPQGKLGIYSILLVDDDLDNLDSLAQLLELHGMTVRTAQNGIEGLSILDNFLPDLIITDLSMPEMNGWDFLRRIKSASRTQHIPVIALTGHIMSVDRDRTTLIFDSYIIKPFNVEKLLNIINIYFPESNTSSKV
jgi:two-component system, chemotaxis family, sensor kinase CheA